MFLQNLVKKYASRVILDNLTYHFPKGERIALVGPNGTGKTTLLNILCGLDAADDGAVVTPQHMVLGYLPQEPNPKPATTILEECLKGASQLCELEAKRDEALEAMTQAYTEEIFALYEQYENLYQNKGGYGLAAEAKGLLCGLGFQPTQFEQSPRVLSGGWRMRLELARVLINNPDILILDEPTNHLDLPSMVWLESFLTRFRGTLIFVSHDPELLNRLSTITVHLLNGKLNAYKGNFDSFLEQYELKQLQNEAAAKHIQRRYADIERFVTRFRAKPSKARQVQSRLKMLGRLKDLESTIEQIEDPATIDIPIQMNRSSGRSVLTLKDGTIGYTKPLAHRLSLTIERGQRIGIIGANGIGKSTLLKTLSGSLPLLEGTRQQGHHVEIGYYGQDQLDTLDPQKTALENVQAANPKLPLSKARSLLGAFLMRGDDVFKKLHVLSGGEKSRVGLSCLLSTGANTLLLDEPTNHLDMTSTGVLGNALAEFEGTILFVSHNRSFINQVATHIFAMTTDGRGGLFEGQLEDYETLASKANFPNVLKAPI